MSSVDPAVPLTSMRPSPVTMVKPEIGSAVLNSDDAGFVQTHRNALGAAEKRRAGASSGDPPVSALPFTTSGALSYRPLTSNCVVVPE